MNKREAELKSKFRLDINRTLLAISFTLFALIVSLNPELLKSSFLIPFQMVASIPMFLSSIFARSKMPLSKKPWLWEEYSYWTFILGYAFLINVIGILLASSINIWIGLSFFAVNFVVSITSSAVDYYDNPKNLMQRLRKDMTFLVLMLLLGLFPLFA